MKTNEPVKTNDSRPWGAHVSAAGGLVSALRRAQAIGATAMQIFARNQRQWRPAPLDEREAAEFRRSWPAAGIRFLCTHASYLCNLASPEQKLRERSQEALIDEIRRADALGAGCVVLHPGAARGAGRQEALERLTDSLRLVLRGTESAPVGVALENTAGQGTALGARIEDLADALAALGREPRLGFCLDTAHAFAAGVDLRRESALHDWLAELAGRDLLDRIWLLHLNDTTAACGSRRDRHVHIGDGEIGDRGFRHLLSCRELWRIPAIIETPKGKTPEQAEFWDRRNLRRLRGFAKANCTRVEGKPDRV